MWNKREKEVAQALLDEETAVLKQLEKHYRLALEDVNLSIRILQADEQTQSKVHRIKYQETIKKQLEGILEKLHTDTYRSIQQYLNDSYTHAFIGVMYDLHGQDVPVIAPIDQNAAIKAIQLDTKLSERKIHPSVNGELVTLYESLGVDVDKLKGTIRSEITRGLSSGMKYDDIARNVSLVSKAPLARAKTIVRTEGHRIQQASQEDARQAAVAHGADVVKQWDSTMDGDTRSAHRELDGQIREVNEPFTYGKKEAMFPGDFGDPAQDCNCRCTALTRARAALDADELATMKERAEFFGLSKEKEQSFKDFEKKYLKAAEVVDKAEKAEHPVKNKNGEVILFDERLNTDKRQEQIAVLKELSDEYDTKLTLVRPFEKDENTKRVAGAVSHWGEMKLSSVKPDVAVHEFAHSMAIVDDKKYGVDGNDDFWKDIRKIRKEYQNARRFNPGLTISAYAEDDLDEFFAEAFTLAKCKEMGIQLPDTYGSDMTYANRVLEAVNKHFDKAKATAKATETLKKQGKTGIIKMKNANLPNGLPMKGDPDSIVDKTDENGKTLQRRAYDSQGMASVDYDTSDHNRPDIHPTGAHKHVFDHSGKKPKRSEPKKLTEEELEQNADIIKRGDNYHDEE